MYFAAGIGPGDEIVIKGHGFGHAAGTIAFRQQGSMGWGTAAPVRGWDILDQPCSQRQPHP